MVTYVFCHTFLQVVCILNFAVLLPKFDDLVAGDALCRLLGPRFSAGRRNEMYEEFAQSSKCKLENDTQSGGQLIANFAN